MDLRTKPIEEAIVFESVSDDGKRRTIDYQPGDGTRYIIVFTDLGDMPEACAHMGAHAAVTTVALPAFGKSMNVTQDRGFLAPSYVREKMECGEAMAVTLAEIIARYTGRKGIGPNDYREHFNR